MKHRIIVAFLIILVLGLVFGVAAHYVYKSPNRPKWSPSYCDQFSGVVNLSWGDGGGQDTRCYNAGCEVLKTKEYRFDRYIYDGDYYEFKCVRKGGNMLNSAGR